MTQTNKIKSLILDMDGVIWRDHEPIGDLPAIFKCINKLGVKTAFATNNGSLTPDMYVERLNKFGVSVTKENIFTSAHAVARLIKKEFPGGGPVYVIGETGLINELVINGFSPLDENDSNKAIAVVVGIDRKITFRKMAEATLLVSRGIPFFATNSDKTFPTPRGQIPGAGAWLSVITTATNIQPCIAGKPGPILFEIAREYLGTETSETLVIGDRLATDIAGGQAAGFPVALVLSGVSTADEGRNWSPKINFIARDLSELINIIS